MRVRPTVPVLLFSSRTKHGKTRRWWFQKGSVLHAGKCNRLLLSFLPLPLHFLLLLLLLLPLWERLQPLCAMKMRSCCYWYGCYCYYCCSSFSCCCCCCCYAAVPPPPAADDATADAAAVAMLLLLFLLLVVVVLPRHGGWQDQCRGRSQPTAAKRGLRPAAIRRRWVPRCVLHNPVAFFFVLSSKTQHICPRLEQMLRFRANPRPILYFQE